MNGAMFLTNRWSNANEPGSAAFRSRRHAGPYTNQPQRRGFEVIEDLTGFQQHPW